MNAASEFRPGTAADAVAGFVPRQVVAPSSVEEAAGLVGALTREGKAIAFAGGGTDLGLGAAPRALDTLLRTGRLDRIVEHSPSDQIVVVEAGISLAALGRALAKEGQRLALDPPLPERATAGGVLAANAFGPLRTRFGGPRDLVIGATMVRADGTVAKGGGKVVKNVAGFDLPRMLAGSIGTLGLVATVAYRLHPLPETAETLLMQGASAGRILDFLRLLRQRQVEPSAVTALSTGNGWDLSVAFEGFSPGVAQQRDRLLAASRESASAFEPLPPAEAASFRERHDRLRSAPPVRVKIAAAPSSFAAAAGEALSRLSSSLSGPGSVWYPLLGIAFVSGEAPEGAPLPVALRDTRRLLSAGKSPGSAVVAAAPAPLLALLDPWGEAKGLDLMRSLKERLDPRALLSPGRFVGGI